MSEYALPPDCRCGHSWTAHDIHSKAKPCSRLLLCKCERYEAAP